MKTGIKILSLLIVLVLSFSVLSGCGSTATKENPTTDSGSSANTSAAASTANNTGENTPEPGNLTLPLVSSPTTLKLWIPTSTAVTKTMKNMGESEMYKEMEKRTGVHIEFIHPAIGQEKETLNLMIASGELPDIFQMETGNYPYPGGLDKGISDGVILKLNDLVDKYAPNFKALINSATDLKKGSVTDAGNIAGFFNVVPGEAQPAWMGPVVRQDWLDELGLKTPETYDDWYTMLKAFKEKKGAVAPMMLFNTGFQPFDMFSGGYGVGSSFYQVDGKIKYGPVETGYRDYLAMLNKWYSEGLVDKDFATKKDFIPSANYTTTGKAGAWYDIYILLSVRKLAASNDTKYNAVAVPSPVKAAGDQIHLRQTNTRVGTSIWSVTASCKNPELAVKWIDYFYSPDGALLSNYGTEGKTYKIGDGGKPQFTEFMYKNPDGLSLTEAIAKYAKLPGGALEYHWERELAGQSKENLEAPDIWGKNNDGAYVLPAITLTSDEGTEYAQIMGDINTYVNEMNLKYILGQESLSGYDEFVNRIKGMNIDRAIQLQQAALDRYNARK